MRKVRSSRSGQVTTPKARPAPRLTLGEVARLTEGTLVGDPDTSIQGIADIDGAEPGDLTYAVDRQRVASLRSSAATAAIVPFDVTVLDRPIVRVKNPYWAWAKVLALFAPPRPRYEPLVDSQAHIAPTATIGKDVVVRPFAVIEDQATIGDRTVVESGVHVGRGARVGKDCLLNPNCVIHDRMVVGDRVTIHANAVIGSDGFGYVAHENAICKIPQIGIVEIGDDVEIGACVTIDRATMGRTTVGRGTKIDNLVQIGHNCEIGANCFIVSQVGISGSTRIGSNCRLAGQSGIVGHVQIGDNSTVAARGVVTKNIPAGSFVSGFPARPHSEEKRIQACLKHLPGMLSRIKDLESCLTKLASSPTKGDGENRADGSTLKEEPETP